MLSLPQHPTSGVAARGNLTWGLLPQKRSRDRWTGATIPCPGHRLRIPCWARVPRTSQGTRLLCDRMGGLCWGLRHPKHMVLTVNSFRELRDVQAERRQRSRGSASQLRSRRAKAWGLRGAVSETSVFEDTVSHLPPTR